MKVTTIYINELFICKCQMLTVNVKMLTAFIWNTIYQIKYIQIGFLQTEEKCLNIFNSVYL